MALLQDKKVLVLHPFLNFHGGAEYLLSVVVNQIVPNADIFSFSYNPKVLKHFSIDEKRMIAPANNLLRGVYRQATPLYPAIIDSLEVDKYDVVLSFSYAYVHGVVTRHDQLHLSYIQTPMRLLWLHESDYYIYSKIPVVKEFYESLLSWQRLWDKAAAKRPDKLLANSHEVARRVNSLWGEPADVIYPPVDTLFFKEKQRINEEKEEYFVTHSRLVRYKRVDLLIEAAKKLHRKLVVVGDGPEYRKLRAIAGSSVDISFTGYVSEQEKRSLLQQAQGYFYAADEDFGIAPVEAMAAGLPVFAFSHGGVTETVTKTEGTFYPQQTAASLIENFPQFQKRCGQITAQQTQARAEQFSCALFVEKYSEMIRKITR